MKLFDLFEQTVEPLSPGEKRFTTDVKVRNLMKIMDKLTELQDIIYHSESLKAMMQKDPQLVKTLDDLITKVSKRKELLDKLSTKPTTSQMNVMRTISQECSDFLSVVKRTGKFLYRGTKDDVSAYEGKSRDDRRAKDSKREISDAFDRIMAEYGVKALRHNSIFTTTNLSRARGYGFNVYMIFPKNGFDFLSTTSEDLILDSWYQLVDKNAVNEFVQRLKAWFIDNNISLDGTNLGWALDADRVQRVMSELENHFIGQDDPYTIPQEFNKHMEDFVSSAETLERFQPNFTDFVSAMRSPNEIMIRGEYWALKQKDWHQLVEHMFLQEPVQSELRPQW